MTGNTLEQRAEFDSWWHKKSPELVSGDWDDDRAIAQAAWEAALRLPAGVGWVLVPDTLTDEMCQAGHKAQWSVEPDGELRGEPTVSLNAIYRTIFAAQIAAAPRHETGEVDRG